MKHADCIIVGCGLAGVTLAWELYKNNISFHIIGKSNLSSSSVIAPGIVNPIVFKRITPSWNISELLNTATSFYSYIEKNIQQKIFDENKIIHALSTDKEKKLWKEKQFFYPEFLGDISETKNFFNHLKSNESCGIVQNAYRLRVSEYIHFSIEFFKRMNAYSDEVFYHAMLIIDKNEIEYNNIASQNIIFCEGHLVQKNPFFSDIALRPAKGELIEIFTKHSLMPENIVFHKHLNFISNGNNKYLIGANYDWEHLNEAPTDAIKEKFLSAFNEIFDIDYEVIGHYAGIRPASTDRRPIIQKHQKFSNMFVINGFGTKGVMLAPYAAKKLLELL